MNLCPAVFRSALPARALPARPLVTLVITLASACSSFAPGPAVPIADEPVAVAEGGTLDDASTIPTGPSLNGCAQASFVDRSASTADRALYFGGTGTSGAFTFSPPCMVVAAGQTVTFTGDFSAHPLSPGTNPDTLTSGTAGNPILEHTTADMTYAVTFPGSGTFTYFCENHYSIGMYGVVRVR